jgi:hypothetical protein
VDSVDLEDHLSGRRTLCAARLVALVDALRSIPEELTPCSRAKVVAVREQIYYGWERPLAAARGVAYVASKYEVDGWWSLSAARPCELGTVSASDSTAGTRTR